MLNNNIFSIIIYKFSYLLELYFVILYKIDRNLEIYFYYTIFILGLPIRLKIENNRKLVLDFKEIIEQ